MSNDLRTQIASLMKAREVLQSLNVPPPGNHVSPWTLNLVLTYKAKDFATNEADQRRIVKAVVRAIQRASNIPTFSHVDSTTTMLKVLHAFFDFRLDTEIVAALRPLFGFEPTASLQEKVFASLSQSEKQAIRLVVGACLDTAEFPGSGSAFADTGTGVTLQNRATEAIA